MVYCVCVGGKEPVGGHEREDLSRPPTGQPEKLCLAGFLFVCVGWFVLSVICVCLIYFWVRDRVGENISECW